MTVYVDDTDFTLHVGDALDVLRTLPDGSVDCCVTSPPYEDARKEYPGVAPVVWEDIFHEFTRVVTGAAAVNVGRRWQNGHESLWWLAIRRGAARQGWHHCDTLVWAKPNANPIHGAVLANSHEYVLLLARDSAAFNMDAVRTEYARETLSRTARNWGRGVAVKNGDARQRHRRPLNELGARGRSVIAIDVGREKGNEHPAPMPLELAQHLVSLCSWPGQTVLDPFAGSGTTCLAARRLGRTSIGVELNPAYAELAARRLQQQSLFAEPAA